MPLQTEEMKVAESEEPFWIGPRTISDLLLIVADDLLQELNYSMNIKFDKKLKLLERNKSVFSSPKTA